MVMIHSLSNETKIGKLLCQDKTLLLWPESSLILTAVSLKKDLSTFYRKTRHKLHLV